MKFLRLTSLVALIAGFIGFSSCGGGHGSEPTVEQAQLVALTLGAKNKTSQTWALTSATLDGVEKMVSGGIYSGFAITIGGSFTGDGASYDYTIVGRPVDNGTNGWKSPWPLDAGKWKFGSPASAIIIRDPDLTDKSGTAAVEGPLSIGYEVTATQLTLTFTYNDVGYSSRTSNVSGEWIMKFKPQ